MSVLLSVLPTVLELLELLELSFESRFEEEDELVPVRLLELELELVPVPVVERLVLLVVVRLVEEAAAVLVDPVGLLVVPGVVDG